MERAQKKKVALKRGALQSLQVAYCALCVRRPDTKKGDASQGCGRHLTTKAAVAWAAVPHITS